MVKKTDEEFDPSEGERIWGFGFCALSVPEFAVRQASGPLGVVVLHGDCSLQRFTLPATGGFGYTLSESCSLVVATVGITLLFPFARP